MNWNHTFMLACRRAAWSLVVGLVLATGLAMAEPVEKDLTVKAAKGEHLGIMEEHKIRFEDFAREYLEWSQANKAE